MESNNSSLQSWQWGLIALGIVLFIIIVAFIVWRYRKRNINCSMTSSINDEEKNGPTSPMSAATIIIDEGIDVSKAKETQEGPSFYGGQQFPDVPHGLSPPKRSRKESNGAQLKTSEKKVEQEKEDEEIQQEKADDLGKMRSVFSLSPPYHHQQESSTSIHSIHSMTPQSSININRYSGINSSNSRTNTPFNPSHHNTLPSLISSMWRGPTPPWTQYSPRQKSPNIDH